MRISRLAIAISFAFFTDCAFASADTDASQTLTTALGTVTVVGTRSERSADEVPATVTVIERERLDREQSRTLKDLLRYEAGVSVSQGYGRFGIGEVRIRGLGGNRVQLQLDGVDIADSFAIGSFSSAGRDFVDPELLERVEILRGAASALYGSDALGGVVAFRTRDPLSLLADTGEDWTIRAGAHSVSDDRSVGANALWATAGDVWSALLQFQQRQGHESENQGTVVTTDRTRTAANPQDYQRRSALAKLVRQLGSDHRLRLVLDTSTGSTDTDVFSGQGPQVVFGQTVLTSSLRAEDQTRRTRASVGMEGDPSAWGMADHYEWQLYRQASATEQATFENRAAVVGGVAINPVRRERVFQFDQDVAGLELLLRKDFSIGSSEHALSYGASYKQTRIDERRDGRSFNLTTGAVSSTIFPDTFPVRDFPLSHTRETGVFVQDEISLFGGRLEISPALRWDRYSLTPTVDAIFAADNPGVVPVGLDATEVSPKLSLSWRIVDGWRVYANVAEGFRAPPYNDANLGFTNVQSGYTAIPNPDLRPETSRGVELGSKFDGRWGSLAVAVYDNRYEDFIDSLRMIGIDPNTGLRVFQSQNIARVRIRGAELQGRLDLGIWGADGWQARLALATARGDDQTRHVPLNSIDPAKAVLGVGYEGTRFGAELVGSFAQRKTRLAPLAGGTPAFAPPGYGVFDLLTHVRLSNQTHLDFAVLNLTDRTYWDWADVPGVAASSPLVDRYSRPGRGFRLAIRHAF